MKATITVINSSNQTIAFYFLKTKTHKLDNKYSVNIYFKRQLKQSISFETEF